MRWCKKSQHFCAEFNWCSKDRSTRNAPQCRCRYTAVFRPRLAVKPRGNSNVAVERFAQFFKNNCFGKHQADCPRKGLVVLTPSNLAQILEEKTNALQPLTGLTYPAMNSFLDGVASTKGLADYKHFPPACHSIWKSIVVEKGATVARAYLATLILMGMQRTLRGPRLAALPSRVREGQIKHFEWISTNLTGAEDWLEFDHDTFQKEFGLATLRLYVCGAQLVDHQCGVPRSMVLTGGSAQVLSRIAYFFRAGGFKPFFQIHTHVHRLEHFNEAGWNECYQCCAELYSVHPEVLGMCGGSWFYDPKVKEISPRLRYLQDIPVAGGARLFRTGPSEDCTNDALSTSPTRRDLFNRGIYQPCGYALVWDRASQSGWAAAAA